VSSRSRTDGVARGTRLTTAAAALAAAIAVVLAGCGGSSAPGADLAFVSTRDGDYAIFGLAADGSGQARLTDEKGDPSTQEGLLFQVEPAFSPDGTRIAFASGRDGSFDIYVMNADGTGTQRLTSTGANDQQPSWSPDGTQIAFSRSTDGGHVLVMNVDGTDARRLTDDLASESDPAWSPDGEWIAYSRREPGTEIVEIWLARPDGSERRQLTTLGAESFSPAWSPDGKRLAFAANRGGSRFDIYTIGADGKELRRAVRSGEDAFEPAWSPDGETLAFSRGGAIVTVDAAGNEVQLTDPANNDSSPVWNPRPPVDDEG
jgi:Tol biopolymer transport system component